MSFMSVMSNRRVKPNNQVVLMQMVNASAGKMPGGTGGRIQTTTHAGFSNFSFPAPSDLRDSRKIERTCLSWIGVALNMHARRQSMTEINFEFPDGGPYSNLPGPSVILQS